MAQRVQVLLVCDVHEDDTPGSQTVRFALDGANYEIDLCDAHVNDLHEALAAFVAAGRRAGGGTRGRAVSRSSAGGRRGGTDRQRTQDIRQWARSNGLTVNERGRIPAEIVAQYESSNR
jgi:hypothetical protein